MNDPFKMTLKGEKMNTVIVQKVHQSKGRVLFNKLSLLFSQVLIISFFLYYQYGSSSFSNEEYVASMLTLIALLLTVGQSGMSKSFAIVIEKEQKDQTDTHEST